MEDTISDLQAQIERLSLSVRQWLDTHDELEPMQQRLSQLTERCAEIVNRWSATDERHAHAVAEVEARLGEWAAIENRLQQESVQRMREVEHRIEHDWKALREIHEAPAQQLREQAAALGETCVAAANLALRGFERAEARFAALETDLKEQLSQLSRDVHDALAEMKADPGRRPALGANVEPFPLDGVMRIHEGLREAGNPPEPKQLTAAADIPGPDRLRQGFGESGGASARPEGPGLRTDGLGLDLDGRSVEHEASAANGDRSATAADGLRRYALLLGGSIVVLAIVLGVIAQRRVSARIDAATERAAAAERQSQAVSDAATRQIAATRADADRQIAEARQAALRADIVSNLLAAPDVIRFNLAGTGEAAGAYAQLMWSRSRGMVLSGSRLPPPASGGVYQLWLLTADAAPVSGGLVTLDASGRPSLAVDTFPSVPRRVTSASVTLEGAGGAKTPSGPTVLARVQPVQ